MTSPPLALAAIALATLTAAAPALALGRPTDDRFQGWLQQEAARRPQFFTGQFESDDVDLRLARTILERLWENKAYREWLHHWLDTHQAPTAEDLIRSWIADYENALAESLEFADKSQSVMWRLSGHVVLGAMDRSQCAQATPQGLTETFRALHARLLAEQADQLARVLPDILGREFARQNHPQKGDRQVDEVMVMIARNSLQAEAATLPLDDRARLVDRFSYVAPENRKKTTLHELCEQDWVVSHAIDDGRLSDASHQVSSLLLQQQVTMSAYHQLFSGWQNQGGTQPARAGFTPGKATIATPELLARHDAAGSTRVRIRLDETGRYQGVSLVSSSVQPEQVDSIDGSTFKSADLLLGVIDAYYRDGTFQPRTVDGVAKADEFVVDFTWR